MNDSRQSLSTAIAARYQIISLYGTHGRFFPMSAHSRCHCRNYAGWGYMNSGDAFASVRSHSAVGIAGGIFSQGFLISTVIDRRNRWYAFQVAVGEPVSAHGGSLFPGLGIISRSVTAVLTAAFLRSRFLLQVKSVALFAPAFVPPE